MLLVGSLKISIFFNLVLAGVRPLVEEREVRPEGLPVVPQLVRLGPWHEGH